MAKTRFQARKRVKNSHIVRGSYRKNEMKGPPIHENIGPMLKFHRFAIKWYIPYIYDIAASPSNRALKTRAFA